MTILGWYERIRLARYFSSETLAPLAEPGKDFSLRLNNRGKWQLTPVAIAKRRMTALGDKSEHWNADCRFAGPLVLRLEALYAADVNSKDAFTLLDFTGESVFSKKEAAKQVTQELKFLPSGDGAKFPRMAIGAKNSGDSQDGAWTRLQIDYPFPHKDLGKCRSFGLWVKGDASGAILNIQFKTPYTHFEAVSDHYIDIDFTGWKFFTLLFRERDAERMQEFKWPYKTDASVHANARTPLDCKYIAQVNIFLNNIPPNGGTNIELGNLEMFPIDRAVISNPLVTVNGRKLLFPVALQSGEYLELDGDWQGLRFSENGTLLERFKPVADGRFPQLNEGANKVALDAKSANGFAPRAELTLFTYGKPFGDVSKNVDWKYMAHDYELPRTIFREDGIDNVWTVIVRDSGGKAQPPKLEFDLDVVSSGVVSAQNGKGDNAQDGADAAVLANPTLNINGQSVSFQCNLKAGQRLRCRNWTTFTVLDEEDHPVHTGRVIGSLPKLKPGAHKATLTFGSRGSETFNVTAKITKVYK